MEVFQSLLQSAGILLDLHFQGHILLLDMLGKNLCHLRDHIRLLGLFHGVLRGGNFCPRHGLHGCFGLCLGLCHSMLGSHDPHGSSFRSCS